MTQFGLPFYGLYAGAGATGLFLILTIVFAIVSKSKKKKAEEEEDEDEEVEEVQEAAEEEVEELPEEIEEDAHEEIEEEVQEIEEEPKAEEETVEEIQEEEAPAEEVQEEEPAEEVQEEVEEEPIEEETQEEPQAEEAQEEEVQEEIKEEEVPEEEPQVEEEPEEEQMVAEENKEAQVAAPLAVEEEVQEEEVKEEPIKEEPKQVKEEPKAAPQPDVNVAAFIKEQTKLNESIEKRLEGIDNSLKTIADALRALLYDAVPAGVATVTVPAEPVEAHEEAPTADGGDYFDQIEEQKQIEDQNAEIAENYAEGWIATADQDSRIKPKMSFEMRLRVADEDIKRFYSDIKNELLSYGVHDRLSRHRENFNQGRINICRMVINGKTLKVYLAVDPDSIDKRYFHQTDVGHRKGLIEMPTMINVRSKVAARKVKELITLMMESLVISKKPYEPHDFAADLTADGFTSVECKGYDYLVEKEMTLDKAKEYPDSFAAQLIEMVEDNEYQERFIKTTLTLDDIAKKFKDGDVVDIDKIRELGLGPANSNFLSVKESKKMNKKLKVYANEFTPDAVKMICLSGGETFLVVQPQKTIEEV